MNLIPLNSSVIAGSDDGMMIVNFDHVYCISRSAYRCLNSPTRDPQEGSTIFFAGVPGGRGGYTLEVKETRLEILRMLQGPGKHSCPAKKTSETQYAHD
jgi:hypothetical protein